MTKKDYQKQYRQNYKQKNKRVTFPLSNIFYEQLRKKSIYYDLTVNSYAKQIITNFLNSDTNTPLTKDRSKLIQDYIHISRGIANNINQIAHKTNMGEYIDTGLLINSLKHYEDEFKKFISKS
jgi:hypothetical protein